MGADAVRPHLAFAVYRFCQIPSLSLTLPPIHSHSPICSIILHDMALLQNLLEDIASQGRIVQQTLGNDAGHLFEPKPWKTYDQELPPRQAWEASQKIIADCEELIALLTPTKVKLVTECISNNSTVGLGVAADLKVADKIIENGGEATLAQLARACKTDEHKLGWS